jgi:hypothetical protein
MVKKKGRNNEWFQRYYATFEYSKTVSIRWKKAQDNQHSHQYIGGSRMGSWEDAESIRELNSSIDDVEAESRSSLTA